MSPILDLIQLENFSIKLYNFPTNNITIIFILYLYLTLIVVVKIKNQESNPQPHGW